MRIRREEHMAGGNGHVIIKELLDAEQLNGKCGLYAQVTLEPGCSLDIMSIMEKAKLIIFYRDRESTMIMVLIVLLSPAILLLLRIIMDMDLPIQETQIWYLWH